MDAVNNLDPATVRAEEIQHVRRLAEEACRLGACPRAAFFLTVAEALAVETAVRARLEKTTATKPSPFVYSMQ